MLNHALKNNFRGANAPHSNLLPGNVSQERELDVSLRTQLL